MDIGYCLRDMYSNTPSGAMGVSISMYDGALSRCMVIDVSQPVFEVPLFVMPMFCPRMQDLFDNNFTVVVPLIHSLRSPSYKSVPCAIAKEVFSCSHYDSDKLWRIKLPAPNEEVVYYGSRGVVFNESLKPMAICSWRMSKTDVASPDSPVKHIVSIERPVLRISPECYLAKADPVQSFINNKMLKTLLADPVRAPWSYSFHGQPSCEVLHCGDMFRVRVIIEDWPYPIESPSPPSVSVTQQDLVDTVLDNIDDLDQMLP